MEEVEEETGLVVLEEQEQLEQKPEVGKDSGVLLFINLFCAVFERERIAGWKTVCDEVGEGHCG